MGEKEQERRRRESLYEGETKLDNKLLIFYFFHSFSLIVIAACSWLSCCSSHSPGS